MRKSCSQHREKFTTCMYRMSVWAQAHWRSDLLRAAIAVSEGDKRAQEERRLGNIFYVNWCNSREILSKRWAYGFGKTHFGEGSLFSFSTLCLCNVYTTFFHRERVACLHFFAPSCHFCLFSFVKTCSFFYLDKFHRLLPGLSKEALHAVPLFGYFGHQLIN